MTIVNHIKSSHFAASLLAFVFLAVALTVTGRSASAGGHAFVTTSDGNYTIIDQSTLQTVGEGNVWNDLGKLHPGGERRESFAGHEIAALFADLPERHAFLVFGDLKEDRYDGFIVLRQHDFQPVAIIRQSMAAGPVVVLETPNREEVYASFLKHKDSDSFEEVSAMYDEKTFGTLSQKSNSTMHLLPGSCFLSHTNLVFSGKKVYEAHTGKLVGGSPFDERPFVQLDCQAGKVLFISASADKKVVLTVFDPLRDQVIAEIKTDTDFSANVKEWQLGQDGKSVIQDEQLPVPLGDGRVLTHTGRLTFYDVASAEKKGTMKLDDVTAYDGVVNESSDHNYLFYRATGKLYVIDLINNTVRGEIKTAAYPVGVVWP